MGAVAVKAQIHDALMQGPQNVIELFNGYTYSGHPAACAALLATLDIYEREGLFDRARSLEPYWQQAIHSLAGAQNVIDVRNLGLVGAVELAPCNEGPGARGYDALLGSDALISQFTLQGMH